MKAFNKWSAALALSACAMAVQAQQPLKIGFIGTLSTPAGYLGEDERDAFLLAIKQGGGKLGGVPVELVVEDDGLKPATGKQTAEKMLQDGIRVFTGINFSNVLMAVVPSVAPARSWYMTVAGCRKRSRPSCSLMRRPPVSGVNAAFTRCWIKTASKQR